MIQDAVRRPHFGRCWRIGVDHYFPQCRHGRAAHCCKRAIDWEKALRRAARNPALKSGSFSHLYSVRTPKLIARAASSVLRFVRSAMIASSCLAVSFPPKPAITCHPLPLTGQDRGSAPIVDSDQIDLAFPTNRSDSCRDRGHYRARRLQNDDIDHETD